MRSQQGQTLNGYKATQKRGRSRSTSRRRAGRCMKEKRRNSIKPWENPEVPPRGRMPGDNCHLAVGTNKKQTVFAVGMQEALDEVKEFGNDGGPDSRPTGMWVAEETGRFASTRFQVVS